MRPFWSRIIRHSAGVGVSLAIIGYLLAHAFLISHRMYAAGSYNPDNERVLWQTPLVMAAMGIVMMAGIDLLSELVRKRAPVPVTPPSANPTA
jgi:uncharacterized membrane protein YhhN